MADLQNRRNFVFGFGQHDDQRTLAVGGESIAFEGTRIFMPRQDRMPRHDLRQRRHNLSLTLDSAHFTTISVNGQT